MIIYFLEETYITEHDVATLGNETQDKIICFRNRTRKKCRILGYERDGIRYVEIQTDSFIDRTHKNIVFEYIIEDNVRSVMIGKHAICFHIPIMQ